MGNRRAWLAALMLCALLVPAAASLAVPKSADPAPAQTRRLRRTNLRLADVRGLIQDHSTEVRTLKKEIDSLNATISTLQISINRLNDGVRNVRARVEAAEQQIALTRQEIDRVQNLANDQAVALYMAGGTDTLAAILDSETIGELNDRIEMLGVAAQNSTDALVRYGRLKARIRDQSRELFEHKSALTRRLAERTELLGRLDSEKVELSERFRRLDAQLGQERDREHHLETTQKAIRKRILTAEVGAELAALGRSSEGFIWPLNGGVTSPFGYRWGRLHQGIDIDGYSGQPIAATKSGVVIYAGSGMSGYGNVVMIAHGGGISTLYAHMSRFEVHGRAKVDQGAIVGRVGCSGSCYGEHLHFEVRVNGKAVDPMRYLP